MLFSRHKPTPRVHDKSRRVGLDLTASRVRAVVGGPGTDRPIVLDDPAVDLALVLNLDHKPAAAGRAGVAFVKKSPHHVCTSFLPHLTEAKVWKAGRHSLTADAALGVTFAKIGPGVASEAEAIGLCLPSYLTVPQIVAAANAAAGNKLPIAGTALAPLAVVADRAEVILKGDPAPDDDANDRPGIVPIRPAPGGPGSAVVVDADDHALTASVVWVDRGEARLLRSTAWPKLSSRAWADRLIDAVSDRCVRQCRRDPRDSADAEQSLFDQLAAATADGPITRPVSLHLRAAHWFQDLVLQPSDFDTICTTFVSQSIQGFTDLIYASGVPAPPRAIWLTSAAARLPGLAAAVYENSAESTTVATLPPDAVASAAARLAPRWHSGDLPRRHLDVAVPLAAATPALAGREKVAVRGGA
jgi:hypothetical protein